MKSISEPKIQNVYRSTRCEDFLLHTWYKAKMFIYHTSSEARLRACPRKPRDFAPSAAFHQSYLPVLPPRGPIRQHAPYRRRAPYLQKNHCRPLRHPPHHGSEHHRRADELEGHRLRYHRRGDPPRAGRRVEARRNGRGRRVPPVEEHLQEAALSVRGHGRRLSPWCGGVDRRRRQRWRLWWWRCGGAGVGGR